MKEFLRQIAVEAGRLSLGYRAGLSSVRVSQKSAKNLVTEADVAIERFLVEQIQHRFPDHAILGEEGGAHGGKAAWRWIIDPIDGTNSFLHQQPFYSTSIALEKDGQTVLGAVYAPVLDELFMAERGQGATLNGSSIRVSAEDTLINCLLGTGFACLRDSLPRNNLPYLSAVLPKVLDIRRSGSVAIDLCYVACARLDAFWELNLRLYDIAAGWLILEEAGGRVTDFAGGAGRIGEELVGSNARIHQDLVDILRQVDGSISA